MLELLKNRKIIYSFIVWLLSIGLFDSVLLLKKENEQITNTESLFLGITVIIGIISFLIFILTFEKIIHQKYPSVKASIFSALSFMFLFILGFGLIISPFILLNKYKNKEMVKPAQASKNTLISAGLRKGSSGEEVKVLQSALATDKSIYPSGIVSGYYGELTKQAVINFQQKYNLSQTGEINQQTADKFNEVYGDRTREYYLTNQNNTNTVVNTNSQNYFNSDPLINCNIHTNCGGGTRLLKKSICDQSTCCQIGNSWIFYEDKSKCTQDQNNVYEKQNNSVVDCYYQSQGGVLLYDFGKIPLDECDRRSKDWWARKEMDVKKSVLDLCVQNCNFDFQTDRNLEKLDTCLSACQNKIK